MSHFVITGAHGGAPNRLEINDFVKHEKFFSLYMQAMRAMEHDNQNNLPSFFSVGKIHGLPYRPWDGAIGGQPWNPNTTWGGYCTHGSVLFPTWHRPYMMLHEQIIQTHAKNIAATYQYDRDAWIQAAIELRYPYWDWALKAVPPDEVISLRQVTITAPNGSKVSVDNPLYHYNFHPVDRSFPYPYDLWPNTLRQPTTQNSSATDNVALLKSILQTAQTSLTSRIYNTMTRVTDWPAFSNHTIGDGGSTSNSLEAVHDSVHFYVGGHMANPALAAFDPIFFLHHSNVDRLVQLWAALNPGVWVTPNDSESGTFTILASTPIDQFTSLTPFWNTETSFWVSAGTQDTRRLGYTYPEFNGLDLNNPQAVRIAIGNIVNKLYGSSIFDSNATPSITAAAVPVQKTEESVASGQDQAPVGQQPVNLAGLTVSGASLDSSASPTADHDPHTFSAEHVAPPNHGPYDWTTRIHCKKYELGCSFAVLLFLGKVPDDPKEWQTSPNYVGGHHAFVNSNAFECANCRSQTDVIIEGFVHLNKAIVTHSGSNSLELNVVEPYLKDNLHWRVQKMDGVPSTLTSLEVCVYHTRLSYPPGAMFPVPGERSHHGGITHGKEGGCRDP